MGDFGIWNLEFGFWIFTPAVMGEPQIPPQTQAAAPPIFVDRWNFVL